MSEERIRIDLERSGGFAGVGLHATVDTAELPAAEAGTIRGLVERVDWDALARPGAPSRMPDRFQYDLSVTRGAWHRRLSIGESAVTPDLRLLLDHLADRARRA